jgi:hypothetical protein
VKVGRCLDGPPKATKILSMYQPESPKVEVVGGKISRDALTDLTDCRFRSFNVVEVGQIRTRRADSAAQLPAAAMRLEELRQAFTTSQQKDTYKSPSKV